MQLAENSTNRFVVLGKLLEVEPTRYTPAGLPVCEFKIAHESEQVEEKIPRLVKFELKAITMGLLAKQITNYSVGSLLECHGFIAQRSYKSKSVCFHVNQIKFKTMQVGETL